MIQKWISSRFESDTLSTDNIILSKADVESDIQLTKGQKSEDYELEIKVIGREE